MHLYEESIRVPLVMRGPGIPQGVSVDALVINADLAPTIVDVGEREPGGLTMDGRSLIPVAEHPGIERDRELLIEEPSFKAIRTERYMYAEHNTGEKELYDLQNDPYELQSRHNATGLRVGQGRAGDPPPQAQGRARALACRVRSGPEPSSSAAAPGPARSQRSTG